MANPELSGDLLLCEVGSGEPLADGFPQSRAIELPTATLGSHVCRVVGRRAEKQMVRTNAWTVVAMVENPQASGDRAVGDLPRDAVSRLGSGAAYAELAVAVGKEGTLPFPAAVASLDELPETLGERSGLGPRLDSIMERKSFAAMCHWKCFRT